MNSLVLFVAILSICNAFLTQKNHIASLLKKNDVLMNLSPKSIKQNILNNNIKNALTFSSMATMVIGLNQVKLVNALEDIDTSSTNETSFITTDSGLQYKDIKVGDGESPIPG